MWRDCNQIITYLGKKNVVMLQALLCSHLVVIQRTWNSENVHSVHAYYLKPHFHRYLQHLHRRLRCLAVRAKLKTTGLGTNQEIGMDLTHLETFFVPFAGSWRLPRRSTSGRSYRSAPHAQATPTSGMQFAQVYLPPTGPAAVDCPASVYIYNIVRESMTLLLNMWYVQFMNYE